MRTGQALSVLLMLFTASPCVSEPQPPCVAPQLAEEQVRQIVDDERATRTDLPEPFSNYRVVVRRQGCHYRYIEYGIPATPEDNQIFTLNQHGVIVDAYAGGPLASGASIECPEKIFTEGELAEILKQERARRTDLPAEFPEFRTRVQRMRCLYLYFEYALPEVRGKHQVFTIDPLGELLEITRSQPY